MIEKIIDVITQFIKPKRIWLFGSRACQKNKTYSDFDIALQGAHLDVRTRRLIMDALDSRLGVYCVDLVSLDNADVDFVNLVTSTGKVIYETKC